LSDLFEVPFASDLRLKADMKLDLSERDHPWVHGLNL
jgi:hypothetical protein